MKNKTGETWCQKHLADQHVFQLLEKVDADGSALSIWASVQWASANTWASTGRGEDNNSLPGADRVLMTGYLDTGADSTSTVTISGIPESLTAAEYGYDVYVYALGGVPGRGGSYQVVDPSDNAVLSAYIKAQSPTNPAAHAMVPTGDPNAWGAGTYLVFRNLAAGSIRIEATTVDPWGFGSPNRAPINAVQLVPSAGAPRARFTSFMKNTDGSVTVGWEGDGVLQAAPAVSGPWETVGGATSPYTFQATEAMVFGRIRAEE